MPVAYFYWGSTPLSWLRAQTLTTFRRHHHDWDMVVVRGHGITKQPSDWKERQDFSYYAGKCYLDETVDKTGAYQTTLRSFMQGLAPDESKLTDIHISDIFGWYVLGWVGGVVSDMDILYTKKVPEPTPTPALVRYGSGYRPVSFMVGGPSRLGRYAYHAAMLNADPNVYESCGFKALQTAEAAPAYDGHYEPLDPDCVFPWAKSLKAPAVRKKLFEDTTAELPDCTFGIHWYGGHSDTNRKPHPRSPIGRAIYGD